jgi:hypothetical protein
MKTSEMRESKFLKQGDVGKGVLWTVHGVEKVNVAKEGVEPDYKWAVNFHESDKPLVLNSINIQLLEKMLGDDTDRWEGKKVVLYVDPTVSFQGKVVGGIRVRAPKPGAVAAPPPPPPAAELTDDDIPF